MGTRADFYVGKGKDAEWIGSIAWDGYRDGIDYGVLSAKTEKMFRAELERFFAGRDDVTRPDMGWPWPWDDSSITDCSYWFFDGQVWDETRKYPERVSYYAKADEPLPVDAEDNLIITDQERIEFPDMSGRKSVTYGKRSGTIWIGLAPEEES